MKTYLITAVSVIFLSVIISMVLPEGKLNKTIVFVMRMACILALIQPVTKIFDIKGSNSSITADFAFIESVYSKNQSSALKEKLINEFGEDFDCNVDIIYADGEFKLNKVTLSVDDARISTVYNFMLSLGYKKEDVVIISYDLPD